MPGHAWMRREAAYARQFGGVACGGVARYGWRSGSEPNKQSSRCHVGCPGNSDRYKHLCCRSVYFLPHLGLLRSVEFKSPPNSATTT